MFVVIDASGLVRAVVDGVASTLPDEEIVAIEAFDAGRVGRARLIRSESGWRVEEVVAPSPSLATLKRQAIGVSVSLADAIGARVTARYPAIEVASWPTQAQEARAVKAGGGASAAPLIAPLAAAWGLSLDGIADLVLAKASAYAGIAAALVMYRDATASAITAATDAAGVETALTDARAGATALVARLGLTDDV